MLAEQPDAVLLYGDTNSTLAGAIAASKIHIPVIHIEAGLRSFNKSMPEEINRIMCDHVSTLLFSPTKTGFDNLIQEGFLSQTKAPYSIDNPKIYHCGDVMYDNSLFFSKISDVKTSIINDLKLKNNGFILATIHRNNNTDEPIRMNALFKSLNDISINNQLQIVLPLHPRTSNLLDRNLSKDLVEAIRLNSNFKIISPVSFLEMLALEKNCCLVMTDSGGVQKEAFYFEKPCVILRPETEWIELLENGSALIADADENKIKFSFEQLIAKKDLSFPKLYGDGKAAEFICSEIINQITTK
ncbi:MAG: UDP-N-acetylglucosamine 2-epimerase (non-hydrolyzing) [Sphingobacteriia bacterium]|nr:UDP-N-acetylglucosamine 2-epimerase (non-hydrolyzing) [Candidatus Fonsibacter lacus]